MGLKHLNNTNKLTKKYLMSLRAGRFLVGNVCDHHYQPSFAEHVVQPQLRTRQWERIKARGADGRLCDLFKSEQAFRDHARRKRASEKKHGYEH
ncbi:MAG TPA: hypothetical protein VKY92_09270 [Verrucomicrobiae bacterium]|nr:hypothetical protein [Verrucomicrobiae bacterium]